MPLIPKHARVTRARTRAAYGGVKLAVIQLNDHLDTPLGPIIMRLAFRLAPQWGSRWLYRSDIRRKWRRAVFVKPGREAENRAGANVIAATALAMVLAVLLTVALGQPALSASPAAQPSAAAARAKDRAMLRVLRQLLHADLKLSNGSAGSRLRRYIIAINYIDVSRCPARFQTQWAIYLKACRRLDRAARMAHWDPRLAVGLVKKISFGATASSGENSTVSHRHSVAGSTESGWHANLGFWNSGGGHKWTSEHTEGSSHSRENSRGASVSSGGSTAEEIGPEGNRRINALDYARDRRKFALAKLCATAVDACAASSRAEYLQALMLNFQICFTERQFGEAFHSARTAARLGDVASMICVAELYRHGIGDSKSYAKAMAWYRKAAAAGSGPAMYGIGCLYQNGQGVPTDFAKAMAWFRKGAAAGSGSAMCFIGWLYANGLGVPQDYAKAVAWFRKAAAAGSGQAVGNIGLLYAGGQGVPLDYAKAMAWCRKGAAAGSGSAMCGIGTLYANGEGRQQDYSKALAWYRKAAAAGSGRAMNDIGWLYENGLGVQQDYTKAIKWLKRAEKHGGVAAALAARAIKKIRAAESGGQ